MGQEVVVVPRSVVVLRCSRVPYSLQDHRARDLVRRVDDHFPSLTRCFIELENVSSEHLARVNGDRAREVEWER